MSGAYYNEFDPNAAAWLRELIKRGHIADGDVDDRSIQEVRPDDLSGYTQCHFFAGIGGWSYALRLAGWPDDRPVWTASLPCQPFSVAGNRRGVEDKRHLWPVFRSLVNECAPPVCFGEQVGSGAGREWLSVVRAELGTLRYVFGAADLCAASAGAPHVRQRLFWGARRVGDTLRQSCRRDSGTAHDLEAVADADRLGHGVGLLLAGEDSELGSDFHSASDPVGTSGRRTLSHHPGWSTADWLFCRDGFWRPVEPGTFPLVDGVSRGLGRSRDFSQPPRPNEATGMRIKGYGNAIVPQVAAQFVHAYATALESL